MATFWTEAEIYLDVNKIYENLSDLEVLQLVNLLVEENLVISTNTIKSESINFLDDEWRKTLMVLTNNRHRLSNEDEEIIKSIANKL
jgi:hypothetical protein